MLSDTKLRYRGKTRVYHKKFKNRQTTCLPILSFKLKGVTKSQATFEFIANSAIKNQGLLLSTRLFELM